MMLSKVSMHMNQHLIASAKLQREGMVSKIITEDLHLSLYYAEKKALCFQFHFLRLSHQMTWHGAYTPITQPMSYAWQRGCRAAPGSLTEALVGFELKPNTFSWNTAHHTRHYVQNGEIQRQYIVLAHLLFPNCRWGQNEAVHSSVSSNMSFFFFFFNACQCVKCKEHGWWCCSLGKCQV